MGLVIILALCQIIGIGVVAQKSKGRVGVGWSLIAAGLDAVGFWIVSEAIWSQPEVRFGVKKVSESTEIAGALMALAAVTVLMSIVIATLPKKRSSEDGGGGSADRPDEKTCPRCAEKVKAAASVCRFCQHEFAERQPAGVERL